MLGHDIACDDCGARFIVNDDYYEDVSSNRMATVDELIPQTRSDRNEPMIRRLNLAEKFKAGSLTDAERNLMIVEPFMLLNPMIAARALEMHLDKTCLIGMLSTIGMAVVTSIGFAMIATPDNKMDHPILMNILSHGTTSVFVLGLLVTFAYFTADCKRYARRELFPLIVRSLSPLQPTLGELEKAIQTLKREKKTIGDHVAAREIQAAILRHGTEHA